MSSVAYILPGRTHSTVMQEYKKVAKMFENENIKPIPINFKWNRTTISENVEHFLTEYSKHDADKRYILGFSFGAIIAFLAATKVSFNTIILCSLSPYFAEDLPTLPKTWIKSIGKRRFNDFSQMNNKFISKQIKDKVILIYGTGEGAEIAKRAKDTYKNLALKKELVVLNGVKHNLADPNYLVAVEKAIKTL